MIAKKIFVRINTNRILKGKKKITAIVEFVYSRA
jgi:hypothetical protein